MNDTLCRIELCWQYAERTGRHLIIDTTRSSLHGAFGDFFELVVPNPNVTLSPDAALLESLDQLVCRPVELQGRVSTYEALYRAGHFVDQETGASTQFTSAAIAKEAPDFPEPLLVYDDCGGGTASFALLLRLRFTSDLASRLRNELRIAGTEYAAVHVRNTDLRTEYRRLLAHIRDQLQKQLVLVCSDDPAVIEFARGFFRGRIIEAGGHSISKHHTGALHLSDSYSSHTLRHESAVVALRDLVLLANASRLYGAPVKVYRSIGRIKYRAFGRRKLSGFSRLALFLCERKDVLDAILNVPVEARRRPEPGAGVTVFGPALQLRRRIRRVLNAMLPVSALNALTRLRKALR